MFILPFICFIIPFLIRTFAVDFKINWTHYENFTFGKWRP